MNNNQGWQRRHAIQIVAQLPEDTNDALAVLRFARELVEGFLSEPQRGPVAEVTSISAATSSR